MNKKVIVLGLALSLIPAVANARGYSHGGSVHISSHKSVNNPYSGYKHIRVKRYYKGQVTIYKH